MLINLPQRSDQAFVELPGEALIFGRTATMKELRGKVGAALSSDLPVHIQGESGTGKEVLARYLHAQSGLREAPFVKLNCAGIPANLLESEFFGATAGAHSGAGEDRPGLIEIAGGGTLFLNDIDAISLELQDRLLDVLRDGTYTRMGSAEKRMAHIRIVCASNDSLIEAVQSGTFRKDLFDRIRVIALPLPPLRERKQDIPELCEFFLQKLSRQFHRGIPRLSRGTLEVLMQWDWPGNLRELENWIARVVILGGDEALALELKRKFKPVHYKADRQLRPPPLKDRTNSAASLVTVALILKALQANRGNRRKAADELKMSYRAFLFRLRSVGMLQKRRSHGGPRRSQ